MIKKYVNDIAAPMGIQLSRVSLMDGKFVGCLDSHSLMISADGCNVTTIIYQTDLDLLKNGGDCHWLDARIRETLSRLQMLLEM